MDPLYVRTLLLWFAFVPVAILNGIVRESTYKYLVGELASHQISSLTAALAFLVVAYFILGRKAKTAPTGKLWSAGAVLVLMTMAFEFGFGHYVDGASWDKLIADYNFLQGNLWAVLLLFFMATPYLVKKIARRFSA